MNGVNYKGREVNVEVAESRSEDGQESPEEKPARERKPRREERPVREDKPRREEKPAREKKSHKVEKPVNNKRKSKDKIERHTAQRAPQVQVAQDDDFWRDFESGDWRQFFRSDNGKPKKKASARKEKKPARKVKVNGRKASRTVTKPKKSRR